MHPLRNYFAEYKGDHKVFIETGTYRGDGVRLAIEAGYNDIHTIDIVEYPIEYPACRYIDDSPKVLSWLMPAIKEPAMIWLDAHSQLMEDEPDNFPLIAELTILAEQDIRTHTIMIDDLLMMTHPDVTGWDLAKIRSYVKAINPEYRIQYLSNPIRKNILVAHI